MPARQKMTPVEVMIMLAIFGIVISIALPAMKQAQERQRQTPQAARSSSRPPVAASPNDEINTIEVSDLSQNSRRGEPGKWVGVVVGLLPIAISIAVVAIIVTRLRQQMTRHRAR